jgi:protein CpxP
MRDKWRQFGFGVMAVLLLLGFAGALTASAQNTNGAPPPFMGRGMRGGPPPGGPMGLVPPLGRLNLTDAQRDQVKSIADSHKDDTQALIAHERDARQALDAAITAPQFDEGAVRTAAANLAQVDADFAVLRARVFSEVFQVLTPEQQDQLKTMQTERTQRQAQRGPRGRGGRGRGPQ